jgi:hypothetical protein
MCIESTESKNGALASTYIFAIDCTVLSITCLFFRFVSNNALIILSIYNLVGMLACITSCIFIYESPKWLIMKKRTKEAIEVINKIAVINGSTA